MTLAGDLAIVGLACRFPGARDAGEFWTNLCAGRESISWLDDEALAAAGVTADVRARESYVGAAFAIEDADRFDARFFGVSAEEARVMDPQQRILLELAYAALEDAGLVIAAQRRPTGVFACGGGVTTSYLLHHGERLARGPHGTGSLAQIGNDKDFLATRLSFKLNLTGLGVSVQTACSSSLVALHLARTALLVEDVDIAIVAASSVRVPQDAGYDAAENPILSPDGHCRAFSDDACGTVFGSGAGVVVLKRRADAIEDRDHVYALVKGTGATNDGGAKIGYTASSVPGQARAMARALTAAGVSARDIGYVECHGTATKIGDPLELKALERVFRLDTDATEACGIGSVKTNIGHLEQAAGIAGLIKVALMLEHRTLVPSLHFSRGNTGFDFAKSPFAVVRETRPWVAGDDPPMTRGVRLAGVNSLGIGGTNAFAVLAEAGATSDDGERGDPPDGTHLVCLSAKSPERLRAYLERMTAFLEHAPETPVRECCYTINVSRSHHRVRCSGVVTDLTTLLGFFRAAQQESHVETMPAKPVIYACNCDSLVEQGTADALRMDRRFPVFRARFDDLVPRLIDGASSEGPVARVLRTVAFEAALYWQLQAWGIRFAGATGTGLGGLVSRLVSPPAASNELVAAVRAAVRAAMAQTGEGTDPIAALASPEDEAAAGPSESPAGVPHTLYRRTPPLTNATAGTASRGSTGISDGERLSARDVLLFLARHLAAGGEIDWASYYGGTPTATISLPTYPFSRDRHWLDD